jgi:hypothetical protein
LPAAICYVAIYSRGCKFVYLVLKYPPFYSLLADSLSLSQRKGGVICSNFSLLTQTPLPPLYLTLPLNITNYSRGCKFVYLVLKYTPFYSVLAGIVWAYRKRKGLLFVRIFPCSPKPLYPSLFVTLLLTSLTILPRNGRRLSNPFTERKMKFTND